MEPSFEKLLVLLTKNELRFVLVEGLAVTLHGYVRLTEDVDILVEDSEANIGRLLTTLEGFGEGWARNLSLEDFGPEEGAIRIVEEVEQCQIDIFTRMSGLRFQDLMQDAAIFNLSGHTVRYASKAALIRLKSQSVREKDQMDVRALQQLIEDPDAFA